MQKEQESVVESLVCPSFSAYSSNTLHHIADQVTRNDDRFPENDTDFEFVAFRNLADGVFLDAGRPAYPIFDRDVLAVATESSGDGGGGRISSEEDDAAGIQITQDKLVMDDSPSSSSSEVEDGLENVPPGTYCVWTPNTPSPCRKSKSTGSSSSSSKRWKLLDLLRRSNSEGKESVVLLTKKKAESGKKNPATSHGGEKRIRAMSAHEALYVRNREMRSEDKRRSYLPYRVGFCVNLNSMGKAFPLSF